MLVFNGKIPVRITPFFWLLLLVISWINSFSELATLSDKILGMAIWAVIVIVSVLFHEYGHALTAILFGQTAQIELVGFGGVTLRGGKKLKLWQEFIVIFNGPICGIVLAILAFGLRRFVFIHPSFWSYALDTTIYVNIFWTVVNLLPIQPLDGGKLLGILLEGLLGTKGIKISLFFSFLISAIISFLFFSIQALLAGSLFLLLTFESYRLWTSSLSLTEEDRNDSFQEMLKEAEVELQEGKSQEALKKLQRLCEQAPSGLVFLNATKLMAHIFYDQGSYKEAYHLLFPIRKQLPPEYFILLHKLAYHCGEWQEAITLGKQAYQYNPGYEIALINALCHSHLHQPEPAVGWLKCAMRDGLPHLRAILSKSEFDPIRKSATFQELQRKALE